MGHELAEFDDARITTTAFRNAKPSIFADAIHAARDSLLNIYYC
jgi:hypothetical protein